MSSDKYIALDVHQATTVTSVLNAAGREVDQSVRGKCGENGAWGKWCQGEKW
jgi:hypothetical protein